MEEITHETQEVIIESKKLLKLKVMQGASLSFCIFSLLALGLPTLPLSKEFACFIGLNSLFHLIKEYVSYQSQVLEMKKSDFYIPFLFQTETKR